MYRLLARLFKVEVSQELFDYLRDNGPGGWIEPDTEGKIAEGVRLLSGYFAREDASKLDLDREYARLFCGAGATSASSALPFESLYTSEDHLLMQEARDEVVAWYARYGLGKSDTWKDCEDHLGVELEFMEHLTGLTCEAIEGCDERRRDELLADQLAFVEGHLCNWVPVFAEQIERYGRTDFYKGTGCILEGFVQQDCAFLRELQRN